MTASPSRRVHRVGLISDTHGLLRVEALRALDRSDAIIHAGDIGDPAILERLSWIAPVTAVRGNNDRDAWARRLPDVARLNLGGVGILVIHDIAQFDRDRLGNAQIIVYGHSHRPSRECREGILYVNPGSAGPRRFRLPVSVGALTIAAARVEAVLTSLVIEPAAGPSKASSNGVHAPRENVSTRNQPARTRLHRR